MYRMIHGVMRHLEHYTTHSYVFNSPNMQELVRRMDPADAEVSEVCKYHSSICFQIPETYTPELYFFNYSNLFTSAPFLPQEFSPRLKYFMIILSLH